MKTSTLSPILYKLDSNKKIRQWRIEREDNKYRTIAGLKGGVQITSEWTVCTTVNAGKANELSPERSAEERMKSLYDKKLSSGYTTNIKRVKKAKKYISPMLAKSYEDYSDDIVFPVYSQAKLDGIRCIANKRGLFTRNGKEITSCPHIHKEVLELYSKKVLDEHESLDGELYSHEFKEDFNTICSIVRKQKPNAQELEAAKKLQFWCYDVVNSELSFSSRFKDRVKSWTENPIINILPTFKVDTQDKLDEFYKAFLDCGYEGQMIRTNANYQFKRTKDLLKRKPEQDAEFTILDVVEGEGNRTGTAGKLVVKDKSNKQFDSNIKGNFGFLAQVWDDRKKLIGKQVTIKFSNYTPDGIPRFPYAIKIRDGYE